MLNQNIKNTPCAITYPSLNGLGKKPLSIRANFYNMKSILLSQKSNRKHKKLNLKALVDDEDYKTLIEWDWFAIKDPANGNFYAKRNEYEPSGRQVTIAMHRQIMGCTKGDNLEVDHRDGNGLNNQKHNLRVCTHNQNSKNRKPRRNSSSSYSGVSYHSSKYKSKKNEEVLYESWRALICVNWKTISLGCFPYTPEGEIAAAKAYDKAAKKYFGEFANLNFKEE